MWALAADTFAVIEAKSGASGKMIWKKDINQLAGSVNWCKDEYGADTTIVPTIMHSQTVIERTGTAPTGTRVLTPATTSKLKDHVRAYATALASDDAYRDPRRVEEQLQQHRLVASEIIKAHTTAVTPQG